jgi:hypothetical protein
MRDKTLYVVHCIDTEGPLSEDLIATFKRLKEIFGINLNPTPENLYLIQNKGLDLNGLEESIAKCFSKNNLAYNPDWSSIDAMLNVALSKKFREQMLDDFGGGWVYSWHCVDHMGLIDNPRHKAYGYGKVFNFYKEKLSATKSDFDEINWHFHPLSLLKNPTASATSYTNNYQILNEIMCRRIIQHQWFPTVNRPGFHSERPDSHAFLEQWIPYDYANQSGFEYEDQPDLSKGRYGNWVRAPKSWRGYNPSHDDYQIVGSCRRKIFRCLNIGTRLRLLNSMHVSEAFEEAKKNGSSILAFANHDFRDIRPDILYIQNLLRTTKNNFPEVKIKFIGAERAAQALDNVLTPQKINFDLTLSGNNLIAKIVEGRIFGPQPYLAIETKSGHFYHDNFDVLVPEKSFSYFFDEATIPINEIKTIGVGSAGKKGSFCVKLMHIET